MSKNHKEIFDLLNKLMPKESIGRVDRRAEKHIRSMRVFKNNDLLKTSLRDPTFAVAYLDSFLPIQDEIDEDLFLEAVSILIEIEMEA